VASLPGSAHASIVSHMSPNDSIQFHQAKTALVHRASSLEAPHHLELCHSVPYQVKGLSFTIYQFVFEILQMIPGFSCWTPYFGREMQPVIKENFAKLINA
jgi:hypothetical protein